MRLLQRFLMATILLGAMSLSSSCFLSKPVPYFKGALDTNMVQSVIIPEQLIQKGDILNITVYSDNPQATAIFNQASGSGPTNTIPTTAGSQINPTAAVTNASSGYLVDNQGNIRMHALGSLHVEGLAREQIAEMITERLRKLDVLTNPYCIIRHVNFKIIVLGEVTNPGVFTIPSEKASVLEAIGLAGDIGLYGKKDNIMLIRENSGKRTYSRIDLTDPEVFSSPNFYLRQNDVLVVQADNRKPTSVDQQISQTVTVGLAIITALTLLINLL